MGLRVGKRGASSIEYKDTGCNLHPACLSCPRPRCQFDEPPKNHQKKDGRGRTRKVDYAVVNNMIKDGYTPKAAAVAAGVSRRTVFRALENAKK